MTKIKSDRDQNLVLEQLYIKTFPLFAKYVSKMGGTFEEAKDVFQESLIAYYEKQVHEDFRIEKPASAYLLGICKNKWFKAKRDEPPTNPLAGIDVEIQKEDSLSVTLLLKILKSSGEKCLEILQSFYYQKLSMQEVSFKFGFKSERSATVQKYKCLEKVRENVKQKSLTYADFID